MRAHTEALASLLPLLQTRDVEVLEIENELLEDFIAQVDR